MYIFTKKQIYNFPIGSINEFIRDNNLSISPSEKENIKRKFVTIYYVVGACAKKNLIYLKRNCPIK